jgi:putative protein kinase ArgK-like GTPase of G3E family
LLDHIRRHFAHLTSSGEFKGRARQIAEARVLKLAQAFVAATIHVPGDTDTAQMNDELDRVAAREMSPFACARTLLTRASDFPKVSTHV